MGPKFDPNEIKYIYLRAVGGEVGAASSLAPKVCIKFQHSSANRLPMLDVSFLLFSLYKKFVLPETVYVFNQFLFLFSVPMPPKHILNPVLHMQSTRRYVYLMLKASYFLSFCSMNLLILGAFCLL